LGALEPQAERTVEARSCIVAPYMQGLDVGSDQLVFAPELLADQAFDLGHLDVEERCQRAHIHGVLEELALARIGIFAVADLRQGDAQEVDILAQLCGWDRLRRIVEQIAAGLDARHILVPGLGVHGHHQVDAAAPPQIAGGRHPHLIPCGQALYVGRKDVARADGYAHAQDRSRKQPIGARRARAVDVGELDDEVVDAL
jgi:hypothetical protein